jgi:hypothetical protein
MDHAHETDAYDPNSHHRRSPVFRVVAALSWFFVCPFFTTFTGFLGAIAGTFGLKKVWRGGARILGMEGSNKNR